MIIRLNNADFSANNVGKIRIPIHKKTESLLRNYSRSFSEDDKYSIDTFLREIGYTSNSGVYHKIKTMILPIISNNITECRYNIVDGVGLEVNTGFTSSTVAVLDGHLVANGPNSLFVAAPSFNDISICYTGNYHSETFGVHDGIATHRLTTFTSANGYKGYSHYVSGERKAICVGNEVPTIFRMNDSLVDVLSNSEEKLNNVSDKLAFVNSFGGATPRFVNIESGQSMRVLVIASYLTDDEAKKMLNAVSKLVLHFQ